MEPIVLKHLACFFYRGPLSVLTSLFFFQRNSISPGEREKFRSRSPDIEHELKKRKKEEKVSCLFLKTYPC